jgi:hypothetical protein
VILIAALFLASPSPKPVTLPSPAIITSTDFVAPTAPRTPVLHHRDQWPEGTAIIYPSPGHGQYLHSRDVTELKISVNGAQKGMFDTSPGASGTFAGTSGGNTVAVVARFGNGAEEVVCQGLVG